MNEEKKEMHLQKSRDAIIQVDAIQHKIRRPEVKAKLDEVLRAMKNLKDTQYLFDSGEKELDKLYDTYIPYFLLVIGNYQDLEATGHDPREVREVGDKLIKALDTLIDSLEKINYILPQDEISEASAQAKAEKWKREYDRLTRKTG